MKKYITVLIFALAMFPLMWAYAADIPFLMNYQGSVKSSGTPYNGNGYFKFAFVNSSSTVDPPTYWSNNDTSTSGSEPTYAVTIPVSNGLFSVKFGDNSFTNMTTLQSTVFDESYMSVRTWFSDDNINFTALSPDQRIVSGAYAVKAQSAETAVSKAGDTMTGGLTVPSLTYSTPKQASVTYAAVGFTPQDETLAYTKQPDSNGYVHSGFGRFIFPVTLPAGVTIDGISCNCFDNNATMRVEVYLKKGQWPGGNATTIDTLATTNAGSPGPITLTSSSALNEVLAAGPEYFYYIETFLSGASDQLGFFSVTIHYTYTSP